MTDINDWGASFNEALQKRLIYLSEKKIPELKKRFTEFHTVFATLYTTLLQRRLIENNPYKDESRVISLNMPETAAFRESNKETDFSIRLSLYDNQLDYIATSCVFSMEMFSPDKIKILRAIIWFVKWDNVFSSAASPNTLVMAGIMTQARTTAATNKLAMLFFEGAFDSLFRIAAQIEIILKELEDYYREAYKGDIRTSITAHMKGAVTVDAIKSRFLAVFHGRPFYTEFVEELVKEDYSDDVQTAHQNVLQRLALHDDKVPTKVVVQSGRYQLVEGFRLIGSAGNILNTIVGKIQYNHELYKERKKSLFWIIIEIIASFFGKTQDDDIYLCKISDSSDSKTATIDYNLFIGELKEKVKILRVFIANAKGNLEHISDADMLEHLTWNIYDIQRYSRLLVALDEYFKTMANEETRVQIKGIKPEITLMKSTLSKAILRKEYYLLDMPAAKHEPIAEQAETSQPHLEGSAS
jgi:hypothetical protein